MLTIEQALQELDYDINIDNSIYINRKGIPVPRVTDILSKTISEEYLLRWANSLGFKHISYIKTLNEAAVYGTQTHSLIENFYKGNVLNNTNISFEAFKYWWDDINKNNKVKILSTEESLVCDYFGGTYDTLLQIGDKKILVDYKTSKNITYKYVLQLAAYRYMLYNIKNINIDGAIILQLGKESATYNEVYIDMSDNNHYLYMEQCTQAFLAAVYSYYNTNYVKDQYKILFGK